MSVNKSHTKITKSALDLVNLKIEIDGNKLLQEVVDRINSNDEIKTLWKIMNVNAIDRLGMSDHGSTHFNIVANNGLKIIRILEKNKVLMSAVNDFGLTQDYAEVIVFLASIMHDLGMSIHREGHEGFSLFIARDMLKEILAFMPTEERVVVTSEVLHSIISHRANGKPSTVEAGIVRIADALDMGKGRSRITFKRGEINIYSISDQAIESVEILEGADKPVNIKIILDNPAGVFQVDDLMKEKLKGGGIEKYISVSVYMNDNGKVELFKEYNL